MERIGGRREEERWRGKERYEEKRFSLLPISVFHFFSIPPWWQAVLLSVSSSLSSFLLIPPSVVSLPSFFSAALSFLFPCSSSLLPILVRSSRSHSPSLSFPSSPQNVAFNRASTVLAVVRNPRRFAATRGASGKWCADWPDHLKNHHPPPPALLLLPFVPSDFSLSFSLPPCFCLSRSFSRPLSQAISVILAPVHSRLVDGRQGWNTTPTFATAAEQPPCHRCLPRCPTTSDWVLRLLSHLLARAPRHVTVARQDPRDRSSLPWIGEKSQPPETSNLSPRVQVSTRSLFSNLCDYLI